MTDDGLLWLTYEEAAARLAVKKASVQRMARAKKWARRTGNDGKTRIALPPERLADSPRESAAVPPLPNQSGRIIAAEARAEELAKQIEDLRAERDRLLAIIECQALARPVEVVETAAPVQRTLFGRLFRH